MPNLQAFGTSHLRAVRKAYDHMEAKGRCEGLSLTFVQLLEPEYNPLVTDDVVNPAILDAFEEGYDFYVSMVGGNTQTVMGLVNYQIPFDFVLPEEPDLPIQPEADLVPCGVVRRRLERGTQAVFQTMTALRELTSAPFYHLESPPPVPSEEHIVANPSTFAEKIAERGVAPISLRYKLWRLHSTLVREACEAIDMTFVPAPRSMQDEQGMLRPEAWTDDPTHANHVYGEALIRQLLAISRGERVEATS